MAEVIWTYPARDNLHYVLAPLRRDSELIAEKWLNKIFAAMDSLKRFPESGTPMEEKGFEAFRELLVGPFRIIYRYTGSECRIGAVIRAERALHRAIDPDELP